MELRTDHLLAKLLADPAAVLHRIDTDPLLVKRTVGDLVLANATKELFTPQEEHQLYAKGIVYTRSPWRLVSLPLLKIYNLGERGVTADDIRHLTHDGGRLHFLRKYDGTLVQRFQHAGRVWFTTRGVLEGGSYLGSQDEDAPAKLSHFDFLGTTRRIAGERYPNLLNVHPDWEHLTLVFEFLHPETQVITNYGDRQDVILLAALDRHRMRYLPFHELRAFAVNHGLTVVDALEPPGHTLADQIDSLLDSLRGTDEEGTVLTIEHADAVTYRVKVKSPDYLRILKLVVTCTYARTVEILDAHPAWTGWDDLERHLRSLGNDQVPEEVLTFYREHYDAHEAYLQSCDRLVEYGRSTADRLLAEIGAEADPRVRRKRFAEKATTQPHPGLVFAAFDGRLSRAVVRKYVPGPADATEAIERISQSLRESPHFAEHPHDSAAEPSGPE